jgi:hypothetical protein
LVIAPPLTPTLKSGGVTGCHPVGGDCEHWAGSWLHDFWPREVLGACASGQVRPASASSCGARRGRRATADGSRPGRSPARTSICWIRRCAGCWSRSAGAGHWR